MAALLFLLLLCPLLIVCRVLSSIYHGLFCPLRHIPGPFLARFTDLWYLGRIQRGHFERDNVAFHCKYGPIVRYGPNRFSFDHPQAAPIIYGVGQADKFAKSSFYQAFTTPNPDQPSLFAHSNIKEHAQMQRLYQSTHAMSALVSYEDFVNECADLFDQRLREMAERPGSTKAKSLVDIGHWFQCYAFDVISMITYSERLGFLDHGTDIAGIMSSLEGFLNYASSIGIYSWMHLFLFAARNWFAGKSGSGIGYVIQFTERLMREHQSKPKHLDIENENTQRMDFLSKYEARHRKDPVTYNSWYVLSGCASNMTAGSDTTGISLSAVLFFLMNHLLICHRSHHLRSFCDVVGPLNTLMCSLMLTAISMPTLWPASTSLAPLAVFVVVNGASNGGFFATMRFCIQGAPIAGYLLESYGGADSGLQAYRPAMFYAGALALGASGLVAFMRFRTNQRLLVKV
ncbi:cytochrome P450 [Ilyonectria sp. MPI-CAGE-AT-0026]|nr:cytochrome P450 [Ilyonectria sp. MPI-CAGE-AT-0026]